MNRIFTLFFLLISLSLSAQQESITGNVTDENAQALPGVTIQLKGTQTGTVTDFDGNFNIKAELGQTLVFTFVGFEKKEVEITTTTINVQLVSGTNLEEVVLVGSRNRSRTVTESAVPVDVLDVEELQVSVPQVNVNQILNYVAPSFTSTTQSLSDGTDHIDPASLRGLGPDQVLVLINGKRRHTSSLINVNGTFGRGSVGTDLNAIPAAAIKRIEVLRDGAAAQYGSDAIAGVINVVLKDEVNTLNINVTTGANVSRNANEQTGGMDGESINVAASYGIPLGDKGGFINFSGDFDYRDAYNRMKAWEGSIFNAYNAVEWQAYQDNADLSSLSNQQIQSYAQEVDYFSADFKNEIAQANDRATLQNLLGRNVTEEELAARGLNRSDFNMRVGQSALRGGRLFANFALPLDDNGTELYAFSGLSSRKGNAAGFYRLPNQSRTYTPYYINGFLPEINSKISDKSFAAGIRGKVGDWDIDFSNTWGENEFMYFIDNTSNASLEGTSPTSFDAGGFSFSQNTTNLDVSQFFPQLFEGFNVAFGGEYRLENYNIIAGEEKSYAQYTADGTVITNASQQPTTDFFGNARAGGAQVFPGFSPDNAISRQRNSVAAYADFEADVTEEFLLTFAGRFENYSDFGSTLNFKVASRYKLTDNINLRAAVNTGFRAPSLHQIYYNSTSTVFNDEGNPVQVGTFSNDSRAAKLLGIPDLKEETSKSASLGITAKIPDANLTITADAYFVAIDDRVVYTGRFSDDDPDSEISQILRSANAEAAAFFANAIDTESKGLDIVLTQNTYFDNGWKLKNDLAGTFTRTQRVGDIHASPLLQNKLDTYFSEDNRIYLEEAVPRTKINLTNVLTVEDFNFFLRNVYFGEVTQPSNTLANQEVYSGKVVTDLSVGYNFSESINLTLGANNLFDLYPDRNRIEDNRSSGRFDWPRNAQFGIGGRYLFARLNLKLQ